MYFPENNDIKNEEIKNHQTIISDPDNIDEILNDMFAIPKKKKKNENEKIQIDINLDSNEQDLFEEFNLKLKRKKKKDKDKDKNKVIQEKQYSEDYDPPIYTYESLLIRLYNNFEDKGKYTNNKNNIKMPAIQRIGSKKTGWINFKDCCSCLNKDFDHLQSFITNELSTQCNINGNGYLILKGLYTQRNIEIVFTPFLI